MADELSGRKNVHATVGDLRLTARGTYYRDMLDGDDSEEKIWQRSQVFEFIRSNVSYKWHRILTLPGGTWAFERSYLCKEPKAYFIGLEKNEAVFNRSLFWVPGHKCHQIEIPCASPNGSLYGVRTEEASFIHCHFSAYSTSVFKKKLAEKYRKITGTWMDFTSQLCPEIVGTLPTLADSFHPNAESVPVAISYMACRDIGGLAGILRKENLSRAKYVMELLNLSRWWRYRYKSEFSYIANGIKMETVMAIAEKKSSKSLDPTQDEC